MADTRSLLYWLARRLGDLHAIERGRLPQRLVRRTAYRHGFRLINKLLKAATGGKV